MKICWLEHVNVWVFVVLKGDSSSNKGYPDRIVYHRLRGEIYYVEVKNETYYTQQKRQQEWQEHIEASGGKYFLVDGEEQMKNFIKEYIDV